MIYVKEQIVDDGTVSLDVSGVLDQGAVPVLEGVCERHLANGKQVMVNLEAIVHITREGRAFIQGIRDRVRVANLPAFMAPEGNQ